MRLVSILAAWVLLVCHLGAAAAAPGVIELPRAKFALGDNPAWARREFDDQSWAEISTLANYEKQGFADYDGYSWYRIHVRIPSSLKQTVRWPQRLHLYLSSIDDVDETFLNGVKVGSMGQFPDDPRGYATRWNGLRDYYVDLAGGLVHWDEDNVIAVRVYDGSGGGGFYRDMPTLNLSEITDGLAMDLGQTRYEYAPAKFRAAVRWVNSFPVALNGRMKYDVFDAVAGKTLRQASAPFHVSAEGQTTLLIEAPQRAGIEVRFHFTEAHTGAAMSATLHAPYLLTPPAPARPRINGAGVLGARPGSPIYFRVAATGRAPLKFSVAGLPAGLHFDARAGVISGAVQAAGDYRVELRARNAVGQSTRTLMAGTAGTPTAWPWTRRKCARLPRR
jgi:alpha-galactosidase